MKKRMRLQLSHCTIDSFLRTSANTAGRRRTWHTVQRSPSARATALPRTLAMRWKVSITPLLSSAPTTFWRAALHLGERALLGLHVGLDRSPLRRHLALGGLQRGFRFLDAWR